MLFLKSSRERATWSFCSIAGSLRGGFFPAIDILRSGTRKEELLFSQEELSRTWLLRKYLAEKNPIECMEFMREKLADTKDNKEFFKYMNG